MRANLAMAHLKKAAEVLQSRYEVSATEESVRTEIGNLLRIGNEVDELMFEMAFSKSTLNSWRVIRQEILLLASAYSITTAAENLNGQVGPLLEYQRAASSYSRIWHFH
jgi:hypothetical protein